MCVCISMYICIYKYMYTYVSIYVCIYTYTYAYTYTYTWESLVQLVVKVRSLVCAGSAAKLQLDLQHRDTVTQGTFENWGFQRHHRAALNTWPSIVGKFWCNPNLWLPSVLPHLIYKKQFSHAVSVCVQNDLLLFPVGLFVRIYRTHQNSDVKTLFFNPDISLKFWILLKWR